MKKFKINNEIYNSKISPKDNQLYCYFPSKTEPSFKMKYTSKTNTWEAYGIILRWIVSAIEITEEENFQE